MNNVQLYIKTNPPYFNGPNKRQYYGRRINKLNIKRRDYNEIKGWDIPNEQYFKELLRVSKNQIIWRINYYDFYLGPGRIIWDKVNGASSYIYELASNRLEETMNQINMFNAM